MVKPSFGGGGKGLKKNARSEERRTRGAALLSRLRGRLVILFFTWFANRLWNLTAGRRVGYSLKTRREEEGRTGWVAALEKEDHDLLPESRPFREGEKESPERTFRRGENRGKRVREPGFETAAGKGLRKKYQGAAYYSMWFVSRERT